MKYVIIYFETGRVMPEGPLLLVKANPILSSEKQLGNPLPNSMHAESPNTKNFAFKLSMDLAETFYIALEESKAEKSFWEPNMDDYVEGKITDISGKEVLAYKHYSLRLKKVPDPQEILPNHYQPVVIPPRKQRTIKKKGINGFVGYIKSGVSSFDHMLREYDNNQKVFAYPVLVSKNFRYVLYSCKFSQYREKGFYLMNDAIQPEIECSDFLGHTLLCCGYNRYVTSYLAKEEMNVCYRFYNREANRLIFQLFDEIAYPIPFDANEIVNSYENGEGFSKSEYALYKQKQILEEDVIGFVCCDVKGLEGSIESVLYVLTYDLIENTQTTGFDIYDSEYHKVFLDSECLKLNHSKLVAWAFIYDLQKKAGITGRRLAINDEEKCNCLLSYISSNYGLMCDKEKDMCAYIIPDSYKLTYNDAIQEECLCNYIVNMGAHVRGNGLILGVPFLFWEDNTIPKQLERIFNVIDKRKRLLMNSQIDFKIDAALTLVITNLGVQGPLKNITGIWAFYHLVNIGKAESSPLVSEMILLLYRNNQKLFMKLINQIKSKYLVEYENVKSWLGTKIVEVETTWSSYDDMYCYYELFFEYSNNGKGFQLNDFEKDFFCLELIRELDLDSIDRYFMNSPSNNHTAINIKKQRNFFRNELEKYISNRIENNDFMFKEITM